MASFQLQNTSRGRLVIGESALTAKSLISSMSSLVGDVFDFVRQIERVDVPDEP